MPADTIVTRFFKQGELRPTAPAYYTKVGSRWKPTNWKTYNDEVRLAARALMALGVGEATGDKASCVCILGFNRPEWAVFDLAAMAAGGVPAGIYTTGSPPEVAYILEHTEATVVLVEDLGQWKKIEQERGGLPNLKHVVLMKDVAAVDDDMVLTWDDFNARSSEVSDDKLQQRIDALQPQQLATLIYTSGTTGPPKGVMLSHDNLAWTAQCAIDMIDTGAQDCVVSYLPLSHIAEQMFSLHVPATSGMQVYFAESIKKVADNFKEVRPTVLFAVPRIWEKFYAGVTTKMSQTTGIKAKIADWARDTGMEVSNLRNYGLEPSGWLAFKYDFFNKQVFSKIKAALGLDRARTCVSGAAPISTEIVKFFASLDIPIREVYGQSEDTGPTSFNLPGKTKFGTVGPPIPGVEVKIADDDEILVRGRNVFLGYYKNQADTDKTLIDGWLHSGDLGKIDSEGFLHITGRKKDLIITAGGKNIAPKNIESALKDHNLIGEAVVIGDRRKYLSALISLDEENCAAFASEHGLDANKLHDSAKLRTVLQGHVDVVNNDLARVEQIKKFTVLSRSFSIENGELTPTLKVKRKIVNEHFAGEIESMYEGA